jgi:amino acid adenylation domain-containing protein
MTGAKLLDLLQGAGVELWADNEAVRYRAPKGALTESLRAAILTHKAEILQLLRENGRSANPNFPPLVRIPRGGEQVPLSFAQQRLWFLDQLTPGTSAYNISGAVRLTGPLNIVALEQSLTEVLRRHEILRATFNAVDGQPFQSIAPAKPFIFPVIDVGHFPQAEREAEARRLANEEAHQPFDLTEGPLFRATLFRLGEEDHILQCAMHHAVSDGWSTAIFNKEIGSLYYSFSTGQPSALPELPIQYADFAHWQRQWLQGEVLEAQLSYWRKQLVGAPPALELPTDRPRPAVQTFQGARQSIVLPKSLTEALKGLSRQEGATLFMTLLAAFKILLSRYTGQQDIVVGSPIAGRNRAEIEGLIGFFINTLVLRTDLSGDPSFRELLRRVREVALGAYDHQELPFEKLVEELQPERDLSRTPLFQVFFNMLNLESLEDHRPELNGLTAEPLLFFEPDSKFDLTIYARESNEGIHLTLVYNADLFCEDRIVETLEQLKYLLSQIGDNPDKRISVLSLITRSAEAVLPNPVQELRTEWLGAVHSRFSQQAKKVPQEIALLTERDSWSYGELESRSNQLANYLVASGVQSGETVAIYARRSAVLVWALLGVLKAGGSFLILDPSYPAEHLRNSVRVAKPRAWIVLEGEKIPADILDDALSTLPCRCRLVLSQFKTSPDQDPLRSYPDSDPGLSASPDDRAYVMLTSGTSGKPKAIEGTHRPLSHFLNWHCQTFGLKESDRFSMLSGLSHDPLLRDVFTPLWLGATLCIPDLENMSPGELVDWINLYQVSVVHLTPAMSEVLMQGLMAVGVNTSLRYVFFGGDILTDLHVCGIRDLAPGATCVNFYGATETPQAMSYFVVPERNDHSHTVGGNSQRMIPLGRGIEDVQLLVLNHGREMAGVGELGEIHVRTSYLAKGYLGDETLTRGRFLTNSFTGENRDRLYKTGDLGRYRPDGNVEIVGRADRQVKIRGFRIEPEEIEAILGRHPSIKGVVVVARDDVPDERRLVAYLVAGEAGAPAIGELRSFLKSQLPDYMIPSAFVVLDRLPLTPNGKIDYKALPAPSQGRLELEGSLVAPRTAVEEVLAGIWAELLRVEQVGVHDNFFDLGGHSLLATQVISKLREAFRVDLPLRFLFNTPTVAGLAERIERTRRSELGLEAPPIVARPRRGDLSLSFAQQRLWFLDQLTPGTSAYNISGAVRLTGPLNIVALEQSLTEVLRRHEILRATFNAVDGQPFQSIAPAKPFIFPVIDVGHFPQAEREAEARRLANEEAHQPFDLTEGPLFRATLFRLGEEDHILQCAMHHAVSDGWSTAIFNKEIGSLYYSFSTGQPSALPELPIQYADFAHWQRQWLQGEVLEAQLSYWRKQLVGAPPALELPTDRPRPAVQTFQGARQSIVLPKSLTEALKGLSRQEGATLFMTLLAAFKILLSRYTGQQDIVVGSPIAGRNRAEIEGLIGFFINTLVLRTDLSGDPSFRELLRRVREVALGAYDHQELPFEKLVEELQPERDLSRTPLFQVFFNMLNLESLEDHRPELNGLTAEPLLFFEPDSKFDLTIYARESNEGIHLTLVYNADLFCEDRIVETLEQLKYLLSQIGDNPDKRISELSLVTAKSRFVLPDLEKVLPEPPQQPVTALFSLWATRMPYQAAISHGNRTWNYGELARQAQSLAQVLRAQGIKRGEVAAVYGPRSFGLICSVMGVLLSGAVLLLIDPYLPDRRKQLMLQQAGAKVLLNVGGEEAQNLWWEPETDLTIVFVDTVNGRCAVEESLDLAGVEFPEVGPDDPAYIFFTSGTTGVPKGVLGCHKGLSHFLHWQRETFAISPQDRVAQLTNLSFDPVLRDIFLPLTSGAVLCLPEGADSLGPDEIVRWLKSERISVLHTVPSLAQSWLADGGTEVCLKKMRWVFFAGEPLTDNLVRRWRAAFPQSAAAIVNLYGPTETTLAKCFYRVPAELHSGVQPVGCALPETQALVLRGNHQLCGIGEPGEIVLRTPFRSLGYINAPKETRQRFVKNPWRHDERDLVYFTGDRGRYRPDGTLEILGRLDDQVKIRGVRVEPDEISAVLAQNPAVEGCIVLARKEQHEQTELVAYVVSSELDGRKTSELRSFLSKQLPPVMIPATFVFLDRLPLTANGKVDRQALPVPSRDRCELQQTYVAPRTPVESILAEIWAQLLKVDKVGIHDNFFQLGGHSLLGIQVISRIRASLKLQLPLRHLFEHPTVAELAALIVQLQAGGNEPTALCEAIAELEGLSEEEAQRALIEALETREAQEGKDELL